MSNNHKQMKFRIAIVEDEAPARSLILNFLKDISDVEVVGIFENGFEGLKGVNDLKPDLLFLDIKMPKLNGFEMLELLDYMPFVIFTTAYDQYAVKAFEQNAIDYLLKPFTKQRLEAALDRYRERNSSKKSGTSMKQFSGGIIQGGEFIQRIAVKNGSKIKLIYVEDILYFEAQDDYVMIYTSGEKHLKQLTMKYLAMHLPPDQFVSVHRSYIVRIGAIEQIELYQKDSFIIKLKNGQTIPISKAGYSRLKNVLGF